MAINVFSEQVLTLSEATKRLPKKRRGKEMHVSVLYRWAKGGLRSSDGVEIRLETVQVGGTKCTSLEALQRFFDRLSGDTSATHPRTPTLRQQLARADQAERELAEKWGI